MRRKRIDFDAVFNEFIRDIRTIFTFPNEIPVQGMGLYESVYAMCNSYPKPMHEELFLRMANFLNHHTQDLSKQIKEHVNALKTYASQWDHFQAAVAHTNIICDYLNKVLCTPFRDIKMSPGLRIVTEENHLIKNSPYKKQKIDQLALYFWKSNVFEPLKNVLMELVLTAVRLDRENQSNSSAYDHEACLTFATSLSILAFNEENKMHLYFNEYESIFLMETRDYYKEESQRYANELDVTEFMEMADMRLNQETERLRRYLLPVSVDKIIFECSNIYVANHSEKIYLAFNDMLINGRKKDCELAYRLLSIITDGVNLLTSVYEQFVVDKGKNYLSQDPNLLVDELGSFQQARSDEIANWFRMDPSFVASLDKAFRSLVNTSNTKFPELLSKYCDFLLKRSAESSEQWIDQQLNTVILLFNYIDDKDVFQKYYSRLLAKRLILKTSFNHEIEQLMLSKLKLACGVEYTSKLQRMLTDVHLSHELTLEFNEARFINEFAPLVLTAGAWPVSHINTIQFHSLPSELEVTISAFNDFYNRKYNGRKLTWLWHLCRVDVKLHGFDKRYEISMALYHFIILSMLNHVTTISMGEVSKLLPMPSSEFEKLVQSFTEIQLLTLNAKEIELNLKFTSKRTKIKLNMASAYETTTEYNEKSLNEDRRLFLEATIVRIMKSRRELSHQELVTLVLEQSQTRFHPTPGIIKKCIEQLIEKQYLERAGDDHQNYIYMA